MPLSPPVSGRGESYQQGFQHLVRHNMATSYPSHNQYDNGSQMPSQYGSPTATEGDDGAYICPGHQPNYGYRSSSQGLSYNGGYSPDYQGSVYDSQYSTPATSPPQHMDPIRTRSGLGIPRGHHNLRPMPEGRTRHKDSPKAKKAKKEKTKPEKKVAKLEHPLSYLTRDWTHVPIVDIDAYVNRSAEVRRKEVEEGKNPGKVKRPMNSFMLYRKAYQNRTKDWCLQNNHQVVSQVCGDSWPLEPDEVKEQFSEWARIERTNHQNAHPGYKFSPTKPGTAKASAKRKMSEALSEESDLDDFDWRGDVHGRSRKKQQSMPGGLEQSPLQTVNYPSTRSAYEYPSRENSIEPSYSGYHRSTYRVNNPTRPSPAPYQNLQNGEYYQQSIQNFHNIPSTQDVILKRATTPGLVHSYLGIPGTVVDGYDLLQPYAQYNRYHQQHRIDPSLMGSDQHVFDGSRFGNSSQDAYTVTNCPNDDSDWQQPIYDIGPSRSMKQESDVPFLDLGNHADHNHDSHLTGVVGHKDEWQGESLEPGNEFDKWMDEEHATTVVGV